MFEKFARKIHVIVSVIYGKIARSCNFIIQLPPSKIHIIFTSKCNLACDFCYVGTNLNQTEPDRLSLVEWEKIIDNTPRYCAMIFSGGEAFASKDIYPVLEMFLNKKRLVSVTTNGTLINKDKLKILIEKKLFFLMYSLHGLEEMHDFHVKKKGAFLKLCASINLVNSLKKELKADYPLISIKTVITPENYKQIPAMIDYLEKNLTVHHIYFNLMSPNTLHHSLTIIDDIEDSRLYQNTAYEYSDEVKEGIVSLINYILKKNKSSKIDLGFTDDFKTNLDLINYVRNPKMYGVQECNRPWHEFLLYYDGKITSCLGVKADNIRTLNYNLKNVFKNSKYRNFLNFIKKNEPNSSACASCKEAPLRKN